MTAEELYVQGNQFRRQGKWAEAINCYTEAVELNPGEGTKIHVKLPYPKLEKD